MAKPYKVEIHKNDDDQVATILDAQGLEIATSVGFWLEEDRRQPRTLDHIMLMRAAPLLLASVKELLALARHLPGFDEVNQAMLNATVAIEEATSPAIE